MTITIDTREPDKIVELIKDEGGECEEEHLSTGDFLVGEDIIERKVYGDFIGRLTNSERDIWQQMLAMENAAEELGYTPVLLLEGEWAEAMQWSDLTPAAPTAAIGALRKMGFTVVHLMGPRATAQYLVKMDDDTEHDIGSIRDTPSVPPELYPRYFVEGFIGVGPSRAEDLLERYGSGGALVQQLLENPDDVQEVDGIGDATVEKMVNMITQDIDNE